MSNSIKEQLASTPLFGGNASAVEGLYEKYLEDPGSVPEGWRDYFVSLGDPAAEIAHSDIRDGLLAEAAEGRRSGTVRMQYMTLLAGEVEYPELARSVIARLPRYLLNAVRR